MLFAFRAAGIEYIIKKKKKDPVDYNSEIPFEMGCARSSIPARWKRNTKAKGEIDPAPEIKPAKPDPIDMDEDMKQMLACKLRTPGNQLCLR